MRLVEKDNYFLIEDFFADYVFAGFSKNNLTGDSRKDLSAILKLFIEKPQIAFLKQIHSSKINYIEKPGEYTGDGLITQKNGIVCSVRTADCMPIILYGPDLGITGIIHMGWRGAKDGILDNIKYDLSSFKALVGVGMRKCCYEVGNEFLGYSEFKGFVKKIKDKLYFDPIQFIKNKLFSHGLKKENFFDLDICSFCSKEGFFSFRRDKTQKRTLSFIVRYK